MYRAQDLPSDRLERAVAAVVRAHGLELWQITLKGNGRCARVTITVDGAQGVGLKDLEGLHKLLGLVLDPLVPWPAGYSLDVESLGPCRRLRHLEDVRRFCGMPAAVSLRQASCGRKCFRGVLGPVLGKSFSC